MAYRSTFQRFPKGPESKREVRITVKDCTLITTSDVIFYFYHKHRLLHPNELEMIEVTEGMNYETIIFLRFQLVELAHRFFLQSADPTKNLTEKFVLTVYCDAFRDVNNIYRSFMKLDSCVLQRPIHTKLDPLKLRRNPRTISRYNTLCSMQFTGRNNISIFAHYQPYIIHKDIPLQYLPPPIIERFELDKYNVENYFIEETEDCIVIDFALSELPENFHQYGFIATGIESDKERLKKKYDQNNNDDNKEEQKSESHPKNTDTQSTEREFDVDMFMDLRHRISTKGGPDIDHMMDEDINYYESMPQMQQSVDEIENELHTKPKHECPFNKYRDYCAKHKLGQCPYDYHPQMEKNVDLGNDGQKWVNPNNHKIKCLASARKHPSCVWEELVSYTVPQQDDPPFQSLQDVIHNCFILRVTIFKYNKLIRKDFYQNRIKQRLPNKIVSAPRYMLIPTKQQMPFPLTRVVVKDKTETYVDHFMSPLQFTSKKELAFFNARYDESMLHFINRLNANHGRYHLEAYCLMACLINYPPMFIIEDFHSSDFKLLRENITTDDQGKVWQVLNKLSEGNIDTNKWKVHESSGKGGSGRGGKGALDKNISKKAASCRERYCCRGDGFCHADAGKEGRNATFSEIFIDLYYNIDFLNQLKKHQMGKSLNRFEWIKTLKITPLYYHLVVDQEKSCRMFRLKEHHHRAPITFLRVEFQSMRRSPRYSNEWEYGSFTRLQVYNIMRTGICCGGAKYEFFYFSDGQLRDKVCWMYCVELSQTFSSIKALRNNMGDFENIKNPGKKMSRMGLYNTKSTLLTSLKLSDIELIDDPMAFGGGPITKKNEASKTLTDGCCIINREITAAKFEEPVVSMLSRLGGAKCMLMALPPLWIKKVIKADQNNKRKRLLAQIEKEKLKQVPNKANLDKWDLALRENENRNFNAQAIITQSSKKFEFDKYHLEVAVKEESKTKPAFVNKEFIGAAYVHYYKTGKQEQFEESLKKYALEWFEMLNKARVSGNKECNGMIRREDALMLLNTDPHKKFFSFLLEDINNIGSGFISNRSRKRGHFGQQDTTYLGRTKNEAERCNKIANACWVKAVSKLHIFLAWPSCRIEGVADWTQTLEEHEIFLKIEVPPTVELMCESCKLEFFYPFWDKCECGASRPRYYVHEGEVGLLKNPCLHPRSYKRFTAVRNKELNELFEGECLLFSTKPTCKTSPVFAMSGADLDGDDFLVVTQQDLIPLPDEQLADIEVQKFDEQGMMVLPEYIDDYTIVDYFLEYALHENTQQLSQLHEAFSEHYVEGISHPKCIQIAKYHSFALDFPKTGKAAIFPDNIGIPNMEEVNEHNLRIFPHYMTTKHKDSKFHSKMIKGKLFDFVMSQLPKDLRSNYRFQKDAKIAKIHECQNLPDVPQINKKVQQPQKQAVQKQQQHKASGHSAAAAAQNNRINAVNPPRYENIDDDELKFDEYHWLNDATQDHDGDYSDPNRNDSGAEDEWIGTREVTYTQLKKHFKVEDVKQYLEDGERLTIEQIKDIQNKLAKYMQKCEQGSLEQHEAFHLDYYYTSILEQKRIDFETQYMDDTINID